MIPTFHGLETVRRALFTQQSAISVTGHNIANVNTKGYSRQRVNFQQTNPFPAADINRPEIPGQLGTGVEAGVIERVREYFLDIQYRGENNKLGYYQSMAGSLSKLEDIMNEPSETGLSSVLGQFWESLQDLSTYPESDGTRQVVIQRAESVVDTFHYLNDSLTSIKNDIGNEIGVNLKEINSLLKQISELNNQIGEVEPHGYLPNDLYDQRDTLVDQLSQSINIKVTKRSTGGNSAKVAEGQYNITLVGTDGRETALVTGSHYMQLGFKTADNELTYEIPPSVKEITVFNADGKSTYGDPIEFVNSNGQLSFSNGKLRGLIEAYGYEVPSSVPGSTSVGGIFPDVLDDLDKFAFTFANIFNEIHSKGYTLNNAEGSNQFFIMAPGSQADFVSKVYRGASKALMLGSITPSDIAASTSAVKDASGNIVSVDAGDGKNADNLANIAGMLLNSNNQKLEGLTDTIDLTALSVIDSTGSLNSFYEGVIGGIGVDAQEANRLSSNSGVLAQSVDENRHSVSSVSIDEEFSNLIKFQHAYNAAARQITVIDEMLDKIINGMGVAGR